MARLPAALRKRESETNEAIRLRKVNLERLQGRVSRPVGTEVASAETPVAAEASVSPPQTAQYEKPQEPEQVALQGSQLQVPQSDYLRNRLSTVEGMLRSESEQRRMEQLSARQREGQLQQRLEALQREQDAASVAAMPLEELRRYVTAQQLQEFGEEHCRLIVAAVKAAAGELTRGAVQQEVAQLRAELAQQRAAMQRSQDAAFWAALNAQLPRWREVNADAGFLRWLGERDVLAGRTRQEVLNEARAALDADRVVAIFKAWPQGQAKLGSGRDASRRVIPNGKPPATLPAEGPGEQAVSRGWIAEQNRLYSQGYYRRRPKEWEAVQQTIDRAAREGRIR